MINYVYDVIFLDTDNYLTNMICKGLKENGLKVGAFQNWLDIFKFLTKDKTRILIFNEICYNMDMIDFIKRARRTFPDTKLVLTLENDIDEIKKDTYFNYKVDEILIKPFSIVNILDLINQGGTIMNNNYPQNGYGMPPQNNFNGIPQQNNFNNQPFAQGNMGGMPMNGMPPQGYDMNGMPPQGGYGQQMPMGNGMPQNDFGQMPMNGMPPQGGYGQQMPMGNGMPQNDFGQMPMNGMPPQGGYGQQMPMGNGMPQNDFGQMPMNGMPPQGGYGQQMPMGNGMPQNDFGQMPMNGMPPQGGYGQQMPMGIQQPNSLNAMKKTVIAINCPKGGVGKTTISKELAIAFATKRINGNPLKVCLVDGNLGFGDVTTMLRIPSVPNIKTWTTDIQQRLRENPDVPPKYPQQVIEENYLIQHQSGLYVLAAPASHTDSLDIDAEQMGIVIDNLKECNFDIIIIDTANNTADYTLIALEKAQQILMITTLEVTSINDTRCLITTLREIQFPVEKIKLVINKMPQKSDKDIDLNEISAILQIPILGVVPDFPKVRLINNNGEPAMLGKDNELTAAIKDLAGKVVPTVADASNGKSQGSVKQEKKSLFGGMFGKKK